MGQNFLTRVPGKWVLAGEHAVLRGSLSVALPHPDFFLELSFVYSSLTSKNSGRLICFPGEIRFVLKKLFDRVVKAYPDWKPPAGTLTIQSTIPVSAGLGSSAALCVALTHWLASQVSILDPIAFATELEHTFHGKSSGMDIAVIFSQQPVCFGMKQGRTLLKINSLPPFTFFDTGLRSRTHDCVRQVEAFCSKNEPLGRAWDEQMGESALLAQEGLLRYHSGFLKEGESLLAKAMSRSRECFYAWGLVPHQIECQEKELLMRGARAVRLTGAGRGGFLVALG